MKCLRLKLKNCLIYFLFSLLLFECPFETTETRATPSSGFSVGDFVLNSSQGVAGRVSSYFCTVVLKTRPPFRAHSIVAQCAETRLADVTRPTK